VHRSRYQSEACRTAALRTIEGSVVHKGERANGVLRPFRAGRQEL
jgi:hypothetical protein